MSERLLGMEIHPLPAGFPSRQSNFKLSMDVPVSDAFRVEMQAWLDDFFGTHEVMFICSGKAFVGPDAMKHIAMLRYGGDK